MKILIICHNTKNSWGIEPVKMVTDNTSNTVDCYVEK